MSDLMITMEKQKQLLITLLESIASQRTDLAKEKELVASEWKAINEEKGKVEKDRLEMRRGEEKVEGAVGKERVRLDVGGTLFTVAMHQLREAEGSFFPALLSKNSPAEGYSIFIDRDPFVFRHVANALRGVMPEVDKMTHKEYAALRKDAEYYELKSLLFHLIMKENSLISSSTSVDQFSMQSSDLSSDMSELTADTIDDDDERPSLGSEKERKKGNKTNRDRSDSPGGHSGNVSKSSLKKKTRAVSRKFHKVTTSPPPSPPAKSHDISSPRIVPMATLLPTLSPKIESRRQALHEPLPGIHFSLDSSPAPPHMDFITNLSFEYEFDENGLVFWVGTKEKQEAFKNPASAPPPFSLSLTSSHPFTWKTIDFLTSRELAKSACGVNGKAEPAWLQVDLVSYRLSFAIADWVLEGAEEEGKSWRVLREHVNELDWHQKMNDFPKTWPLNAPRNEFYRYLRIRMTKPCPGFQVHALMLSGIEFYGTLCKIKLS
jgi:hypothetical protein